MDAGRNARVRVCCGILREIWFGFLDLFGIGRVCGLILLLILCVRCCGLHLSVCFRQIGPSQHFLAFLCRRDIHGDSVVAEGEAGMKSKAPPIEAD